MPKKQVSKKQNINAQSVKVDQKEVNKIIEKLKIAKAERDSVEPRCPGWIKSNQEVERLKAELRKIRG
jgi:hypothetical protein